MPRPISHFRSLDDPQNTTLCGYGITRRYNIIDTEQIRLGIEPQYSLCARCRARAERFGLIPRQPTAEPAMHIEAPTRVRQPTMVRQDIGEEFDTVSTSDSDKQIDIWLLRLGIQ